LTRLHDDHGAAARRSADRSILETAKGAGFLAGGSFFELGCRFVMAFLLARTLGASGYGLYTLAVSAAALFFGISLLGLDDAMVRYVAMLSGRKDEPGVRGTIQVGLGIAFPAGIAMGALLYFAAEPIADGIFHEPRLAQLLQLVAVVVPFLTVSNVLAGAARGFRRMDYYALSENVVQSLVRLVLLGLFLLLGGLNTVGAVVIFGISDIASTVTLTLLLNKYVHWRALHRLESRRDFKEIFNFAFPLWVSGLLRQFRSYLAALILGASGTAANVGVFAVVTNINTLAHVCLLSIYVAVRPTLAQLHDRGDRHGLGEVYVAATRWSLALNIPFFLVTVLYPDAILSVFGHAFAAGASALIILSVAELVNAGTGICGPIIDMTGHTKLKLVNSLIWTVLVVGSSAVMIPAWGVVGAAIAAFLAVVVVNVLCVIEVWFLEHLQPFDRTFVKPIVAGTIAFVVGLLMTTWIPVGEDLGVAIVQALVVTGVYAGLVVLFGLADSDRLVLGRIGRKATSAFSGAR
jgi:O-antigen/teichoic acid export membrane protein